MPKHALVLKWWLIFTLIVLGSIFTGSIGLYGEIWRKDASYLSCTILAIFYAGTIFCGWTVAKFSTDTTNRHLTTLEWQQFERFEEIGWFISELCLTLGMLGTIIGFVMMLSGFESLDISKQQTIQGLLAQLGNSMATALYTTLVGLVCGCLLKMQFFMFSLALQKHAVETDFHENMLSHAAAKDACEKVVSCCGKVSE